MEAKEDLLSSLFGSSATSQKSAFAERLLDGDKPEIVDEVQEKKDAIRASKAAHTWTEEEIEERDKRTLFIDNIPSTVTKDEIKKLCREFGEVESSRIRCQTFNDNVKVSKKIAAIRGQFDKTQGAVAYVVFKEEADMEKAVEGLQGKKFQGFTLRTDRAKPKNTKQYVDSDTENRQVFVGNLNTSVNKETLLKIFGAAGEIEKISLPMGKHIAFITYKNENDVDLALKFDGTLIEEREVRVTRSNRRDAIKQKKEKKEKKLAKAKAKNSKKKAEKKDGEEAPSKTSAKLPFQGAITKGRVQDTKFIKKYLKKKKSFNKGKK